MGVGQSSCKAGSVQTGERDEMARLRKDNAALRSALRRLMKRDQASVDSPLRRAHVELRQDSATLRGINRRLQEENTRLNNERTQRQQSTAGAQPSTQPTGSAPSSAGSHPSAQPAGSAPSPVRNVLSDEQRKAKCRAIANLLKNLIEQLKADYTFKRGNVCGVNINYLWLKKGVLDKVVEDAERFITTHQNDIDAHLEAVSKSSDLGKLLSRTIYRGAYPLFYARIPLRRVLKLRDEVRGMDEKSLVVLGDSLSSQATQSNPQAEEAQRRPQANGGEGSPRDGRTLGTGASL